MEARARSNKKYIESLKSDPDKKAAYNKRKARDKAKARQNPEVCKITNKRVADCHLKVKALRQLVVELDNKFPAVLNESEKYDLKAANRCRSIKYLTELYNKFEEIDNG